MRVAVLAHSFPRYPGDTHGPFVKDLSEALARRGHEVIVLVPYDTELAPDPGTPLQIESFRYFWPPAWHLLGYSRTLQRDVRLKGSAYLQAPFYFWRAERALGRLIERHRIDLVHAHWLLPNGYVAARAVAERGIPYAVTLHGSDIFMAERNPLFRRLARRALAGAAHVTSCSADLRDRLLALGGEQHADKVLLVPNGTDVTPVGTGESPLQLRRRLGVEAEAPLLVAVGRLVDKKGFRFLVEALPRLASDFPDLKLVLGGGGPLAGELQALADSLGVGERILFTGPLLHPEVLSLIAAADIFVMPSVRDRQGNIDGLPIVVLEAMAAGRPVVATDLAGMPLAVLDGETGRLVPEKDPEALADALRALLAAPETAVAFGAAGRQRVREALNWDAIAAIHDRLYHQAI